jgi:hypothetical protein
MLDCQSGALNPHEYDQNYRGDRHIHSKERTDSVREKFTKEKRKTHFVLHGPRNELPVWKQHTYETEPKVNGFRFHAGNLADVDATQVKNHQHQCAID